MRYNPIEVALAARQAESAVLSKLRKSGGIGHTEIKQVEILAPTVCPLAHEDYEENGIWYTAGYYAIPYLERLTAIDENSEYFLYVDGKEFRYDYNPRLGSGWGDTDSTDRRFHSYYENIGPNIIDPIPETVTASIKQVSKIIHPIEDKYLQNLPARVGLLEKDGVLLEKAEYSFEETSDGSILVLGNVPEATLLKAGMTLTVHFDGINYVCPLTKENEILIAGNSYYVDPFYHEDTGEPFAIVAGSLLGGIALFAIDGQGAHTVGITVGDNSIDPARLPKGCVGYTEPKVITFNGDLTGKTLVDNAFVKLSDEPIDLNEVTRVVADPHPIVAENMGTSRMEFTAETWTIDSTGNGQVLVNPEIGNCLISVTVAEEDYSVGVWGLCETGSDEGGNLIAYAWVSQIEYGEFIHKISPKYLPEGGVGYNDLEVIFPHTELALEDMGSFFESQYAPAPFVLSEGKQYKVVWNGMEYVCTTFKEKDATGHAIGIGNRHIGDSLAVDTGEPFLISYIEQAVVGSYVMVYTLDSTATMSISEKIVHPIDSEYLVKTIDLARYGIDEAILSLFAAGGGMQEVEGVGTFWDDVATSSVLRLVQPYDNVVFEVDQCVRTRLLNDYTRVDSLSFSFMATMNAEKVYTIHVAINCVVTDGVPGAYVYMKVV